MNAEQQKLGTFPHVIAGISYVPLIGILFGVVAIIWGLTTRKLGGRKLALLGAGGIASSVALYSALFYFGFVQRGGVYDHMRAQLAEAQLVSAVQAVEFYKNQNGHYPDTLETLKNSLPKDSLPAASVYDPTGMATRTEHRYFYYELIDKDHYYLLSVGPDGKPFTADDIVPNMKINPGGSVGLVTRGPAK